MITFKLLVSLFLLNSCLSMPKGQHDLYSTKPEKNKFLVLHTYDSPDPDWTWPGQDNKYPQTPDYKEIETSGPWEWSSEENHSGLLNVDRLNNDPQRSDEPSITSFVCDVYGLCDDDVGNEYPYRPETSQQNGDEFINNSEKFTEIETILITETTDVTSTEPTITTTPNPVVPCRKSQIAKDDLIYVVNETMKEAKIYDDLKHVYEPKMIEVRDKHIESMKQFTAWYQKRLGNLKELIRKTVNNLESKRIDEKVELLRDMIDDFSEYDTQYNSTLIELIKLQSAKDRILYNCPCKNVKFQDLTLRQRLYPEDSEFFCGSVAEAKQATKLYFKKLKVDLDEELRQLVHVLDSQYEGKLMEHKNNVKDASLNQFARTFYDILSIQDEIYHFKEIIQAINPNAMMSEAKIKNNKANYLLLRLRKRLEELQAYCLSCPLPNNVYNTRALDSKPDHTSSLLDFILDDKAEKIRRRLEVDLVASKFQKLDDILSKADSVPDLPSDINAVKEEVDNFTKDLSEHLQSLKNMIPKEGVDKWIDLLEKWESINQSIYETLKELNYSLRALL